MLKPLVVACVLLLAAVAISAAHAEDFPGGGSTTEEFEKGFGQEKGLTQADKDTADADRIRIGGSYWSEFQYVDLASTATVDSVLANPNSLWLYGDARLRKDVRGVFKLRTIFDPTVTPKTTVDLEELKLLFNVKKSAFFTIGKQKIKWGSGQFWNPTDFVNSQRRNFLYTQDLRTGVTLVKTHVPVGASNFYLVQKLDDANQPERVEQALRAEIPLFGAAELAGSAMFGNGREPQFGIDLSTALWEFDAYGEFAHSSGTDPRWVLGVNYQATYKENDTAIFAVEYFNNGIGALSTASYPLVFLAGGYVPFHLSRHYGMFMVSFPKPGSWNHITFMLFNIANLSDKSFLTRIDTLITAFEDLKLDLAAGIHYGKAAGEFKIGGQSFDLSARLMIDF